MVQFTGGFVARLIALVSFLSVLAYVWAAALGAVTFNSWAFALFVFMGAGAALINFGIQANARPKLRVTSDMDPEQLRAKLAETMQAIENNG